MAPPIVTEATMEESTTVTYGTEEVLPALQKINKCSVDSKLTFADEETDVTV